MKTQAGKGWREMLCSQDGAALIGYSPHLFGRIMGKDKLKPLHTEWIRYLWDSDVPRALQAFRGSYKTTSVCVTGAVRWMFFNPNDRIALVRKHSGIAADVVNAVAQAMELPQVREVFKWRHGEYPRFKTRRDGRLEFSFKRNSIPRRSPTCWRSAWTASSRASTSTR